MTLNPEGYVLKCALAKDYGPLVWRLRNGEKLSEAERNFLADYLEGKREGRGRGASPRAAWTARYHFRLFYWLTEFEGWQSDHAYDEVARLHGISRRKAITSVKESEENGHAEAVRESERVLLQICEEVSNKEAAIVFRSNHRRQVLAGERLFEDGRGR